MSNNEITPDDLIRIRAERLAQRERPLTNEPPIVNRTTEEMAGEVFARLQAESLKSNPERDAFYAAKEARQRAFKVDDLRANWNAPKRAVALQTVSHAGLWGQKFQEIQARIGGGFLIALIGGRGPGKTQMAVELMKARTQDLYSALYATATEFFMTVKRAYRDHASETELDIIQRFRRPSLLVIDEIGKSAETDWENRLFFELIDKRYQDMRDTLLISNEPQPEFIKSIGTSLASRMQETGGIIVCNWPSFRK